ncbi:hypothetical protein CEV33_1097 [Brucella grignonensis]|uniref:Uncharacterized protein n=1 Tax=Brucella grignonensis TaxID=94627 RepID=A0A256FBU6_9HYPH|nr:hypothetical protein CEV33_1097 [Brucella grignonensis]
MANQAWTATGAAPSHGLELLQRYAIAAETLLRTIFCESIDHGCVLFHEHKRNIVL